MLELDNALRRKLREALVDAFDRATLEIMATDALPERYAKIIAPGTLEKEAFDLVEACRQRGWLDKLVFAAIAARPDKRTIQELARELGASSVSEKPSALQKLFGDNQMQLDVETWRTALMIQEWRVCQVRLGGAAIGTAFLVGPDAVLTNHHVVQTAIAGSAKDLAFLFDYRRAASGAQVHAGTAVGTAKDWLVASSPPSAAELAGNKDGADPSDGELDFALVRLERAIGEDAPGGAEHGTARGFIALSDQPYPFAAKRGVAILQHPRGAPLKLAMGVTSQCKPNGAQTRVRYELPTEPGSSGSPVFDIESFTLIALHHGSDPAADAQYNEGIPIPKIAAHPAVKAWRAELD